MVYKPSLKLKLSMKTFSNHSISKGVVSRNALELILANRIFFVFQCYKLYLKGIPIPERILVFFQVVLKISRLEIATLLTYSYFMCSLFLQNQNEDHCNGAYWCYCHIKDYLCCVIHAT